MEENINEIKISSNSYILATSEYIGTSEFKYMIRSELRSGGNVTLFLLGIPNPVAVYMNSHDTERQTITEKLFQSAVNSISQYIEENEFTEGNTYYGEYQINGLFEISSEKPIWEDGQWGKKI